MIGPNLTINACQTHQIDDTPRAHAATNQLGMWCHTLTVQCKHRKTAELLNSLSKHVGLKKILGQTFQTSTLHNIQYRQYNKCLQHEGTYSRHQENKKT